VRRNHRLIAPLYLSCLVVLPASASLADNLIVDSLNQAQATAAQRPSRGMSMQKVSASWGEPANRLSAVGKPPITRWEYPGFTVYFEFEHVIHAVVKRAS
jgi:hypothetical protein